MYDARSTMLLVLVMLGASCAVPPSPQESDALGDVHFAVSCSAETQADFDHAVALLHHMTYPLARTEFEQILRLDPGCAMAHWGVAMTLFQPLWPTRPSPADLKRGWEAVQAAAVQPPPTERERLYLATVEAFFRAPDEPDYWARIARWETALEETYRANEDDPEAAAFYALALLATAPPGDGARAHHERAAEILLGIHATRPRHPGAVHYLIHANDVRGRERESLEIVRSYGAIAPRNPHALHMPTHIFTRIGSWEEVIDWNERAAEAALEHPAGDDGQYVWDEFPHAIEYLVYAHLQRGDDRAAAAARDRLLGTVLLQPSFKTAFHVASIPARYALERHAWEEAAALVPRPDVAGLDWDRFPWPEAVTWFARGLGSARLDDAEGARRAVDRLDALEAAAAASGEVLFSAKIRALKLAVAAWLASLEGDRERAETLMRSAADLEVSTPKPPVTPGPTLPGFELLGELLLEHGAPERALEAFDQSLELSPGRFNSLLGAARAARALGDVQSAREYYAMLIETSIAGSTRPALAEARAFAEQRDGPE